MTTLQLLCTFAAVASALVLGIMFGRTITHGALDPELAKLRYRNRALETMLDFMQSEAEHVAGMLKDKVAAETHPLVSVSADEMQRTLNRSIKWCEGHTQYDLCHLGATTYSVGQIGLMRDSQEKFTADLRHALDATVHDVTQSEINEGGVFCVYCKARYATAHKADCPLAGPQ